MNKSGEIVFNMTSQMCVGRSVTDLLKGVKADHLLQTLKELTQKTHAIQLNQKMTVAKGTTDATQEKETSLKVNFYCSKLLDS